MVLWLLQAPASITPQWWCSKREALRSEERYTQSPLRYRNSTWTHADPASCHVFTLFFNILWNVLTAAIFFFLIKVSNELKLLHSQLNQPVGSMSCITVYHVTSLDRPAVRPEVWRCLLEQFKIQHGQLPAQDDDQLGTGLWRLVSATHASTGRFDNHKTKYIQLQFYACFCVNPKHL